MAVAFSPIHHAVRAAGGVFMAAGSVKAVGDFGDPAGEILTARGLGLADLSPLPRFGFRGQGARTWLMARGVDLPDRPNRAVTQMDGSMAISRSWTEFLVLANLNGGVAGSACLDLASAEAHKAHTYPLSRFDGLFWFTLAGSSGSECLAKVCDVDMREIAFPPDHVGQTRVAGLSLVVVRTMVGSIPLFHLLGDSASAEYAWTSIVDAMTEFDGGLVGLRALHALAGEFQ